METTYQHTLRKTLIVAAVVILTLSLWKAIDVLLLTFGGVLCAVLLYKLSTLIQRYTSLSYLASFLLLIGCTIVVVIGSLAIAAPFIVPQAKQFSNEVPQILSNIQSMAAQYGLSIERFTQQDWPASLPKVLSAATNVAAIVTGGALQATAIFLLGFFFALSPHSYKKGIEEFTPPKYQKKLSDTLTRTVTMLWNWLLGRAVAMLAVGILVLIGLWILGVPFALLLGIIAGICNFIPTIGPFIGAIPAVLVALSQDPMTILYVIVLFLIVQVIENNAITPFVQQKMVNMSPATIIVSQLLIGVLLGPIAVVIAVPLTVAAYVFIDAYYVQRIHKK